MTLFPVNEKENKTPLIWIDGERDRQKSLSHSRGFSWLQCGFNKRSRNCSAVVKQCPTNKKTVVLRNRPHILQVTSLLRVFPDEAHKEP